MGARELSDYSLAKEPTSKQQIRIAGHHYMVQQEMAVRWYSDYCLTKALIWQPGQMKAQLYSILQPQMGRRELSDYSLTKELMSKQQIRMAGHRYMLQQE